MLTLEQRPDVCKTCYQNIADGNYHIEHQKDGTHLPVSPMYDILAEKGLLDTKTLG